MLNGEKHFTNSPLPNVISIKEPNDKILYGYWVKNTLEYNLHLFFLDEENSESMLSEKLLMENVLLFEDENEHQMFNSYVKTHWCNKDKYIDRDYEVYIPKVIGKDLRPFVVELFDIHILQNMLIEFRKENEFKETNIQL